MSINLFTDGSVNPKTRIGFGAYMAFSEELENIEDLSENIKVKKFENTSSSKLELQTLLWALSEVSERKIISYTDTQTIVGLLARKQRLQESAYCSKAGRQIRNHELYREFFEYTDKFDIQFYHIRGHKPLISRTPLDRFFAFVDKASRKALRIYSKNTFKRLAEANSTDLAPQP